MKTFAISLIALALAGCGSAGAPADDGTQRRDVESPAAADAACDRARESQVDFYVDGELVLVCVPS